MPETALTAPRAGPERPDCGKFVPDTEGHVSRKARAPDPARFRFGCMGLFSTFWFSPVREWAGGRRPGLVAWRPVTKDTKP